MSKNPTVQETPAEVDDLRCRVVQLEEELARRSRAADELTESEEKYRSLVESSPYCIKLIDLEGRLMSMNRSGLAMINEKNEEDIIGRHYLNVVCSHDLERVSALLDRALAGEASEFDFLASVGRYFRSNFVPIFQADGKVSRLLSITQDITDHRRLVEELNHRVKNNLAAVLALADQTKSSAASLDQFVTTLDGRIRALARSHEALARSQWKGVPMHDLAKVAIEAHMPPESGRVQFDGPNVQLPSRACGALMLTMHELTTNAVKHGAFRTANGCVTIEWSLNADDMFELIWTERAAPSAPADVELRHGVGLSLIRGFVEQELDGQLRLALEPTGLVARMSIPLGELHSTDESTQVLSTDHSRNGDCPPIDITGTSVLLIEDNFLAAIALQAILKDLGCTVVGPKATIAKGDAALKNEVFDVAFLDINLIGGNSYSIAGHLIERGYPVVFVTGYDSPPELPPDLTDIPILRKPVDGPAVAAALQKCMAKRPVQRERTPSLV